MFIFNVCDHEASYAEVGSQAVSYTAAVPAVVAIEQILEGDWKRPGVFSPEQMPPERFLKRLSESGLPFVEKTLTPVLV